MLSSVYNAVQQGGIYSIAQMQHRTRSRLAIRDLSTRTRQ